ncbi:MAG: FHA domain-containing protein [Deltaproteobacteria bacterium]|nr:FHA domain-containing protein [Deltaproteobacteria bacterium]
MSDQQFSLAVVRGSSAGTVLRTRRKRISIGSAEENDLVVVDPSMSARHLLILVDGDRWRVHLMAQNTPIDAEERWIHPKTGARGARISVASSELLLYPGFLENEIVEQEMVNASSTRGLARAPGEPPPAQTLTSPNASTTTERKPTSHPMAPLEGREWSGEVPASDPKVSVSVSALPGDPTQPDGSPTIPSPVAPSITPIRPSATLIPDHPSFDDDSDGTRRNREPSREATLGLDVDLVRLSQMQTISGERPPEALVEAAKVRLSDERTPVMRREAPLLGELDIPDTAETVIHRRVWPPHEAPNAPTAVVTPPQDFEAPSARYSYPGPSSSKRNSAIPAPSSGPREARLHDAPSSGPREARLHDVPSSGPREARLHDAPSSGPREARLRDAASQPSHPNDAENWAQGAAPNPRGPWPQDIARTRPMAVVPTRTAEQMRLPSYPAVSMNEADAARRGAYRDGSPDASYDDPVRAGHIVSPHDLAKRADDAALAVIQDPDGAYATRVRLLGTRIDDFVRRLGYRAYMLTSCEPLTGKTTAILNLAFALAEDTHRRVAVIEANFRYPRFAEILGIPATDGIIPVLQGRSELAKAATKIADRNLVILPSGGTHPHPAEVLASPRFKTLIAELANTVDVALVDAPSIRPFADANLLQPLVDGVLLVVAEGSTPGLWLTQAAAQIGEDRVLGTLYNRIPGPIARGLRRTRKTRLRQI